MKQILSLLAMIFVFGAVAHAQVKECSKDVVQCRFYKNNQKAEKTLLGSEDKAFSWAWAQGECAVTLYSDIDYDDTMEIRVNEKTNFVDIAIIDRLDGPGHQRDGGAAFSAQKNTSFYFQYKDHLAVCEISAK